MAGGVRDRFHSAGGSFLRGLGKIIRGDSHLQGFDFHNFPWQFCGVGPHSGDTVGIRKLHIEWNGDSEANVVQSANFALYLPPKVPNCTLEEVAVLRVVQMMPTATQKEIVAELMHGDYFFIPSYQRGFLVGFSLKIRNFASTNRV